MREFIGTLLTYERGDVVRAGRPQGGDGGDVGCHLGPGGDRPDQVALGIVGASGVGPNRAETREFVGDFKMPRDFDCVGGTTSNPRRAASRRPRPLFIGDC